MKTPLQSLAIAVCFSLFTISCKKDKKTEKPTCQTESLLLGKWKFISRKVTDYKTGEPSTPATNTTVNFGPESYIEFKSDNTFKWYETYNNRVYRDQSGTTLCLPNDKFWIYSDQSKGQGIAESIKEVSEHKLVFTNNVLALGGASFSQTVTVELSK